VTASIKSVLWQNELAKRIVALRNNFTYTTPPVASVAGPMVV